MNDRIQELAISSGYNGHYCTEEFDPEQFAELIVEDIIKTLEFHGFEDAISYVKWYAKNKLGVSTRRMSND